MSEKTARLKIIMLGVKYKSEVKSDIGNVPKNKIK